MKKLLSILLIIISIFMFSCNKVGTLQEVSKNDSISVYKYWYGNALLKYVYVAKISDTGVTTLTYPTGVDKYNTIVDDRNFKIKFKKLYYNKQDVLYENDSLIIIKKK